MFKINDSTYVIIGTLPILVGGTMAFGSGTPTTQLEWFGEGVIEDREMNVAIQYLVQNGIIQIARSGI